MYNGNGNGYSRETVWYNLLDSFGRQLLAALGIHNAYDLDGSINPITAKLKEDAEGFVAWGNDTFGNAFSRVALCRAASICQMTVYDRVNGPDGDGKEKALRRHWYHWFKVHFAQPLALALGDYEIKGGNRVINDTLWSARLSQTYAELVDSGEVTYKDLWVEDASRMIERLGDRLFKGFNVILAVEKDSLFADFVPAARAAGFAVVLSGKGKNSKAALEKVLRETFHWPGRTDWEGVYTPSFSEDRPLIILHISDYDYDGEAVIGPTFGSQAERYTNHIIEARIGIQPEGAVLFGYDLDDVSYQVKLTNSAYVEWAQNKALFSAVCTSCGNAQIVVGDPNWNGHRSDCCYAEFEPVKIGGKNSDTAFGLEVEAMRTRDYYALIVRALLRVIDFDYIIERLREEAVADANEAARQISSDAFASSEGYADLQARYRELESQKYDFEHHANELLTEVGEPHISDFADEGEDPTPEDFENHVVRAGSYPSVWRPFDRWARTELLIGWLRENHADLIERIEAAFVARIIGERYPLEGEYTRFIIPSTSDEGPTEGETYIDGYRYEVYYDEWDEVWKVS